ARPAARGHDRERRHAQGGRGQEGRARGDALARPGAARRPGGGRRGAGHVRISQVCIERPVLASVLSIVIALFGGLAFSRLPNRYLPNIDPPIVSVTTILPGAAPQVVETSVTDPIEDQVNGNEGGKHGTPDSPEPAPSV